MKDELIYGEPLLPRVESIEKIFGFKMLLKFSNGEFRIFDAGYLLDLPEYNALRGVFSHAEIDFGSLVWPGNLDICPDTVYLRSEPVNE